MSAPPPPLPPELRPGGNVPVQHAPKKPDYSALRKMIPALGHYAGTETRLVALVDRAEWLEAERQRLMAERRVSVAINPRRPKS